MCVPGQVPGYVYECRLHGVDQTTNRRVLECSNHQALGGYSIPISPVDLFRATGMSAELCLGRSSVLGGTGAHQFELTRIAVTAVPPWTIGQSCIFPRLDIIQ